jgi:PAS domain S-box-containing protein
VALAVDDALNFDTSQHATEALRASEAGFRLIVDSIPGLVNTTTASGEFEFVNQLCLDYCGKTLNELKGWATSDILHPDDLSHLTTAWRRSVETGEPHDAEYRIRRADGVYRWFHVRSLSPGGTPRAVSSAGTPYGRILTTGSASKKPCVPVNSICAWSSIAFQGWCILRQRKANWNSSIGKSWIISARHSTNQKVGLPTTSFIQMTPLA